MRQRVLRSLQALEGHTCAQRPFGGSPKYFGTAATSGNAVTSKGKGKSKAEFDPVIYSGIQPTGTPHLGNYLGFFQPFLDLQKTSPSNVPLYLSIVGLHAITLPQDPTQLRKDRRNMLAALLASGVDPNRTCLYFQEDVPEHAELAWYLNTISPVGLLRRMTTWKSRISISRNSNQDEDISESELKLGLLAYPVLQAADILLYKSTIIPVGEDQSQHLELSRTLSETFNRQFSPNTPIIPIPQTRIVPSKRILSLRDPSQKMSKSSPNQSSRISITDTPTQISKKVKSAVTDSLPGITFDPSERPGLSNLLIIWSSLDREGRKPEKLAEEANKEGWGMGRLKEEVEGLVIEKLDLIRAEFERIQKDEGYLKEVAKKGREKARDVAGKTMKEVREHVGLDPI